MNYFRSRGLPFNAYEVFWNEQAQEFVDSDNTREMYRRCGGKVDIVPQIFIEGRPIRGWRTLEPLIRSGQIEDFLDLAGTKSGL